MSFPRTLFVPVHVPPEFMRYLRSAAARSLGPKADTMERSGVEFQMRTLGARDHALSEAAGEEVGDDVEEPAEEGHKADDVAIENMSGKTSHAAFAATTFPAWVTPLTSGRTIICSSAVSSAAPSRSSRDGLQRRGARRHHRRTRLVQKGHQA